MAEQAAIAAKAGEPAWRDDLRQFLLLDDAYRRQWEKLASTPHRELMPLAHLVGIRPPINWINDPMGALRRAAIEAGIVGKHDMEAGK